MFLRNPQSGEIVIADDPTGALQQGFQVATDEEVDAFAHQLDYGTTGQQAQAQVERVVRGATFGGVEGFGDEADIRARAEVSEELSPVTSFAASIVPDIAVSALTGGLGGLATGAGRVAGRAALAEGAGLVRAGLAAGRAGGAAALAGESLGSGLVSAGQEAYTEERSAIEDPGAFAEDVLFWGGLNFGLGKLMGAGRSARAAERETTEEAAEHLDDIATAAEYESAGKLPDEFDNQVDEINREMDAPAAPEAPPGLVDESADTAPAPSAAGAAAFARQSAEQAADDGLARALRSASKTNADDVVDRAVRGVEPEGDSLGRQRRLYMNRAPILQVATREMQQDLTKVAKDIEQVTHVDKLAAISAHVSDNLGAQQRAARVISEDAAKFAGELRAEAKAYGAASGAQGLQYAIPGQKDWSIALLDHAKQVQEAQTGKAMFEALDGFKRSAQDFKLSLETGALNSDNPIHHQKLIPRIDEFARQIRSALEDGGTWGKAGDMQRAYNAVIHDQLMPSMRVFEESVLKKTHRGYEGIWNTEGWETKIASLLKNQETGARRHVGAVLDAMDELASVRRQYGDSKIATRIEENTSKIRRTMGLADEVQDATERMQAIGEVVGAVPLGGMIRGFVTGDVLGAYQRLTGASEAALDRGVDDWIRSSRTRGSGLRMPKIVDTEEGRQLASLARRRGVSQTMALFMGDDDSPGAAFERWRDALLDDEKFFDELGADFDTLQRSDPDTFLMLSGRAALARQFLIQRMPPNVAVSMAQPGGYPPSREAVEDWAEYLVAVRHPQRTVANVGAMTQPQVEALRTVYPRRHEQLQQRVIEAIGSANASGEPLDDSFMVRAGILFPDADGVGSPVFSREYGKAVREYNLAVQKDQQQRSGAPSKAPKNPLSATIQGGATFGQGF